jgi:hypothetical protein
MVMDNEWLIDGRNILSPDRMALIEEVLEKEGPIIVEHWFYYGSRAPDRFVFDDYESLREYLTTSARPGDAIHIWSFAQLCRDDNTLVDGKYPDSVGRVPKGGAY